MTTQEPREGDQRRLWFPSSNGYSEVVATWTGHSWQIPTAGGGTLSGLILGNDVFDSEVDACRKACALAEQEMRRHEAELDNDRIRLRILQDSVRILEGTL